jgi:hypothetical protein
MGRALYADITWNFGTRVNCLSLPHYSSWGWTFAGIMILVIYPLKMEERNLIFLICICSYHNSKMSHRPVNYTPALHTYQSLTVSYDVMIPICFLCEIDDSTRAIWKVSSHFEYLENWWGGLEVTGQPVRGDLTVHPWTVILPWGQSVGSEMRFTERVYCVTVAFTVTERAVQLHHNNAPAHSTALVQAFFLAKHHIAQVCQPPYSPDLASCNFRLFPKLKSPLKCWRFVNATVTQYTRSVNGISLPTDWPRGRVTVHRCTVRCPLIGCQVTSRPRNWFSRYSKCLDTSCTVLIWWCN